MNTIQEYLKYIFSIDNNTSATIITTLIAAFGAIFITIVINLTAHYITKQLRFRRQRKIFKRLLMQTTVEANSLSKKLIKFSSLLDLKNTDQLTLETEVISHLERINKFDFNEIYRATFYMWYSFVPEKRLKAFEKIFKNIKLIEFIDQRITIEHRLLIESFNMYNGKLNNEITELRKAYDSLFLGIQNQEEEFAELTEFIRQLHAIVRDYHANNDISLLATKEKYIQPIISLCRRHIDNQTVLMLNNLALNCSFTIKNLEALYKAYISLFLNFSINSKGLARQLQIICNSIY